MSRPDTDEVFAEWELAADGVWTRRAARVIVLDDAARILLLRGVDAVEPSTAWWFTPGGGLEPGESERAGATRELFEETGLRVPDGDLVGPVVARTAEFPFCGRRCRQDESLFFITLGSRGGDVSDHGWTAIERASVTDVRWWELDELASITEPIYPPALPALARDLITGPWDGATRRID